MTSYILGYKTFGLNFIKVYKKNDGEYVYPLQVPFFGYNFNPNIKDLPNHFTCYKKQISYQFNILLYDTSDFKKGDIYCYRTDLRKAKYVKKDNFFKNYEYNFNTNTCRKKKQVVYGVKMKGMFICKNDTESGYEIGYEYDYLIKKNGRYRVIQYPYFIEHYEYYVITNQPSIKGNEETKDDNSANYYRNKLLYYSSLYLQSITIKCKHNVQLNIKYPMFDITPQHIKIYENNKTVVTIETYPDITIYKKTKKIKTEIQNIEPQEISLYYIFLYYFYYLKHIIF